MKIIIALLSLAIAVTAVAQTNTFVPESKGARAMKWIAAAQDARAATNDWWFETFTNKAQITLPVSDQTLAKIVEAQLEDGKTNVPIAVYAPTIMRPVIIPQIARGLTNRPALKVPHVPRTPDQLRRSAIIEKIRRADTNSLDALEKAVQ